MAERQPRDKTPLQQGPEETSDLERRASAGFAEKLVKCQVGRESFYVRYPDYWSDAQVLARLKIVHLRENANHIPWDTIEL